MYDLDNNQIHLNMELKLFSDKRFFITILFILVMFTLSACGTKPTEVAITPGGPTRTASPSDLPTGTILPTPSSLLNISASGFTQKDLSVVYAFVIKNLSPTLAAENISYLVRAYDQNGTALVKNETRIGLLLPNQELGFSDTLNLKKDQIASRIEVLQTGVTFSKTEPLPAFIIEPAALNSIGSDYFATSMVTNPYNKKLANIKVFAVAYNSNGDIIGGGVKSISVILAKSSSGVQVKINKTGDVARVDLYTGLPNLAAANPEYETPDAKELNVQEYGFGQKADKASFGILFANPSSLDFLEGSFFHVTAFSAEGKVLAAENGSVPVLLPGQLFGIGSSLELEAGTTIDHIEIQVLTGEYLTGDPKLKFQFESVIEVSGNPGKFTGMLVNPYVSLQFKKLPVYAIARDASGKIVGGGSNFVKFMAAGSKRPVNITIFTSATISNVEFFTSVTKLEELK